MASTINFAPLSDKETSQLLGKTKEFSTKYPKAVQKPTAVRSKLKDWQVKQIGTAEKLKQEKISAIRLKTADLTRLRTIQESNTPTAEAIVGQKTTPNQLLGTIYSALNTLEFQKMESEFRQRSAAATSAVAKAKVQAEWNTVLNAAQTAFSAAGLKQLKEADLRQFSKELSSNRANFNAVVKLANSGTVVKGIAAGKLSGATKILGGYLPVTGVLADTGAIVTAIPDLCSRPFAEGSFTKSFSRAFNLTVRIPYWCPSWTNPFRICHKNFTIAGLSFSLSIQVGYRVTCCGAIVYGQAAAQACATVVGIRFCAGCTARITGVAGFGRSGSGNSCTYGIGVNAQLQCTFGGVTVFNVQAPFGFNVNAPCPPIGHRC